MSRQRCGQAELLGGEDAGARGQRRGHGLRRAPGRTRSAVPARRPGTGRTAAGSCPATPPGPWPRPVGGPSTTYRAYGTPSAGTSSTSAGSASATPVTVPASRASPARRRARARPPAPSAGQQVAQGAAARTARPARRSRRRPPSGEQVGGSPGRGERGAPPGPRSRRRALSSAVVATTALPRKGTGATCGPAPRPPRPPRGRRRRRRRASSGISRPAQPRSAATVRHSPVS